MSRAALAQQIFVRTQPQTLFLPQQILVYVTTLSMCIFLYTLPALRNSVNLQYNLIVSVVGYVYTLVPKRVFETGVLM